MVLNQRVDVLENESKENKLRIQEQEERIKELELKLIDITRFRQWDEKDVLTWIFSINNGYFKKYEEKLREKITKGEVKGPDLLAVEYKEVEHFGVTKFGDQKILINKINELRAVENDNHQQNQINIPPMDNNQIAQPAYAEGNHLIVTNQGNQ